MALLRFVIWMRWRRNVKLAVNILNNEPRTAGKVWYFGLSKIIFENYSSIDSHILRPLSELHKEMEDVSNITLV